MWVNLALWAAGMAFLLGVLIFVASSSAAGRSRGDGTGKGGVGNALQPFTGVDMTPLMNLQAIYEPGKKHLIEQQQAEEREEQDEGDPPDAGLVGRG